MEFGFEPLKAGSGVPCLNCCSLDLVDEEAEHYFKILVYFRHRNDVERIMFWKGYMESHVGSRS